MIYGWCVAVVFKGQMKVVRDCYLISLAVGNKNDCPDKKVVQTEDAEAFSEQLDMDLYETSAKENVNVEEVR